MKQQLDHQMDQLVKIVQACPWEDKAFYAEYLAQSYHYVFYSTRMLAAAASLTSKDQADYFKRSITHLKEEAGHEMMAVADLKALGHDLKDHPEAGLTRALWEPQFYKIQRNPTTLLGYILALEYVTVRAYREVHARVLSAHGEKASLFVRVHADEDPDHVEKAIAQVEALPESARPEIWKNYEQTCEMFGAFLKSCALRSGSRLKDVDTQSPEVRRVS